MPLTVSKGLNAGRSLTRALATFSSRVIVIVHPPLQILTENQ
jgi:hypothetical protein